MDNIFTIFKTNGDFTELMNDSLLELALDEDSYTLKDTINYLDISKNFRQFSDGLTNFIKNHGYNDKLDDIPAKTNFLYKKFCDEEIKISKATIKSWFLDSRPASNSLSRENMFKFCFALGLSKNESAKFFSDVYFEKYFNYRDINELIYFYSLKNGLNYKQAIPLLSKAKKIIESDISSKNNNTIYTKEIGEQVNSISKDLELLEYIETNKYNFKKSSTSAINILNNLVNQAKKLAVEESIIFNLDTKNMDKSSMDFLIYIIHDLRSEKISKSNSSSIVSNDGNFKKIIFKNYPTKITFSNIFNNKHITFDMLRKSLVLLSFYTFWADICINKDDSPDNSIVFVHETNDMLIEAGMNRLYPGNPFDWLFLYCSNTSYPLDTFREIISEILDDDLG
ncbi:MAG: hypothetical protein KIC47_11280 [Clostridium sp.]|nr:hypothetical protein [Clostridium sp.]